MSWGSSGRKRLSRDGIAKGPTHGFKEENLAEFLGERTGYSSR